MVAAASQAESCERHPDAPDSGLDRQFGIAEALATEVSDGQSRDLIQPAAPIGAALVILRG